MKTKKELLTNLQADIVKYGRDAVAYARVEKSQTYGTLFVDYSMEPDKCNTVPNTLGILDNIASDKYPSISCFDTVITQMDVQHDLQDISNSGLTYGDIKDKDGNYKPSIATYVRK